VTVPGGGDRAGGVDRAGAAHVVYLGTSTKSAAPVAKVYSPHFCRLALGGLPQKSCFRRYIAPRSFYWGENAGLSRHEAEDQHDDSQHTCATEHSLP